MPRELVAAVALFGEAFRISLHDTKLPDFDTDADVEGAACALSAIGAMAVSGGADRARIVIPDVSA